MSTLHISKYTTGNQASVLVLLHGWGSSSKIWQPYIDELCKYFEIWCIDLPGHGESHMIEWDGSVEQGMQLLANVLPPVCSVVAWSLGGLWAQLYLQHFPERVQKLMLIASTPKFVASDDWLNGMPIVKFKLFNENYLSSPEKTLQQFIALQTLHGKYAKQCMQTLTRSATTKNFQNIAWGLSWLEEIDLRGMNYLKKNNICLLQGENDQVSSLAAAEDTAKICNNLELHNIAHASHVPFLSHPEIFIEHVFALIQ